jgi:hypothetical protein
MAADTLHHLDDYKRYGRQMILDGIGLPGTQAFFPSNHYYIHQRLDVPLVLMPTRPQVSLSSSRPQLSSLVRED